jgi:2-polyprenyl-6-methoxyphenol hydroxylase-like FAD-dependent oxidoreductase
MTNGTGIARSAVVAGAGIGGLATAIGLRRCGWSVTVLEQAPEMREAGAGWSFAQNAIRAIDYLGLGKEFRAISFSSEAAGTLLTPSGEYLMRFRADHDDTVLANHRAELQHMLATQLPADCVRTDARVTGVRQFDESVTVSYHTEGGQQEINAALVVGADGIDSAIRRSVWPSAKTPAYQRILCWRGVTQPESVWPVEGFQTWGRGARFGAHPLTGQRVFWFLAVRQPRPGQLYDDALAEVRRRTQGWHAPIPQLLDATAPTSVLCHDIYDLDPLPSYVDRRVVLLGDAAHAMTPFLAQGACQAFEDAAVLAAILTEAPEVPAALTEYDRVRRPRTQAVVKMARSDPRISLSTSKLAYWLMTRLTKLAGARIGRRKTAGLWSWTAPANAAPSHY